jgi:antibiotic biosynthesis monooxygenase (ABM) superfamily enzyme
VKNSMQLEQAVLTDWLFGIFIAGNRSPGFWSGEIVPPGRSENSDWLVLHRFETAAQATAWEQSTARQSFLTQFKSIPGADKTLLVDEISDDGSVGSAVTAIVTLLRPEMEEEYWDWEYKVQSAQARFAGFGGVYVQPPPPGKAGQWTTILRFDSPKALQIWFNATERQALLAESNKFISSLRYHKIESSFPGWFPSDERGGKPTPSWKGATMVLIGLFPILLLLNKFLSPLTANFTPILAMAIGTVVSISGTSFVSMPILVKRFNWWLAPDGEQANLKTDLLGLVIAMAIFACEIAAGFLIP